MLEYDEYEKQLLNEICAAGNELEVFNGKQQSSEAQNGAGSLSEAVNTLFDFIDSSLEVPTPQKAKLAAL